MTVATIMGVHHTGATVRDLQRSVAWWKEMFDVEPRVLVENSALSPEICQAIGVPDTVMSYAFLPVGDGLVELLEYHAPVGGDFELANKDVGAMHVAIRVKDVVGQYEHMISKGAHFRHPPIVLDGELEGVAFAYAVDPDGLQVEIWQEP
jgi:glyoxylase I family protein